MLRIPVETDVPESLALVDQGVDSLVAVDVRSWFLKELDTDMPVLKILGGNSILDLASDALERIPKALLDLDRDDDEASNAGQPLSDKKLPETSNSSSSSDIVTGDSDAVSQSSATDVSTTAKSTAGADTASIPPSLSDMKNNNGSDDRHKRELEDEAARKRHEHEEAAAKRREEIVKSSSEIVDEMSLVQSRFWFLTTALEDKTTFNVTISAHLKGRVDVGKLERALEGVAKRHEILRTRFFVSDYSDLFAGAIDVLCYENEADQYHSLEASPWRRPCKAFSPSQRSTSHRDTSPAKPMLSKRWNGFTLTLGTSATGKPSNSHFFPSPILSTGSC